MFKIDSKGNIKINYIVVLAMVAVIGVLTFFLVKKYREGMTTSSSTTPSSSSSSSSGPYMAPQLQPGQKIIKYFGGHNCPHSNTNSHAYNLINKFFREQYPDVYVEIIWSTPENQSEFMNAKAEYVPTITNDKYKHIELNLPEGFQTENKSEDELVKAVCDNVYSQL